MDQRIINTPYRWFSNNAIRAMFAPNEIITTTQPSPARWRIIQATWEEDDQLPGDPSFASLKLTCCSLERRSDEDDDIMSACFSMAGCALEDQSPESMDPNDPRIQQLAEMRVYMQVPSVGTENHPPEIRSKQATAFEPPELQAYKLLSSDHWASMFTPSLLGYEQGVQGDRGLVPSGFYTVIVREHVPGKPLCHELGDIHQSLFWSFDRNKRDKIRGMVREMLTVLANGVDILHCPLMPHHLIWNEDTEKLYMVGFRELTQIGDLTCDDAFDHCFQLYGLILQPSIAQQCSLIPSGFDGLIR